MSKNDKKYTAQGGQHTSTMQTPKDEEVRDLLGGIRPEKHAIPKKTLWVQTKLFYRRHIRKYVSFGFVFMLFLSFILWYITKLDGTYTAAVPIDVVVNAKHISVEAVVSGKGERIFAYRYYRHRPIEVSVKELEISPSAVNPDLFVIGTYSLQNAISRQITDLQIISLGPIPEITYAGI